MLGSPPETQSLICLVQVQERGNTEANNGIILAVAVSEWQSVGNTMAMQWHLVGILL